MPLRLEVIEQVFNLMSVVVGNSIKAADMAWVFGAGGKLGWL
jgi:hypothetical protein